MEWLFYRHLLKAAKEYDFLFAAALVRGATSFTHIYGYAKRSSRVLKVRMQAFEKLIPDLLTVISWKL